MGENKKEGKFLILFEFVSHDTNLQDGAPPVGAADQSAGRRRHSHQHGVAVHADAVGSVVVVRQTSAKLRTFPTDHLDLNADRLSVSGGIKKKNTHRNTTLTRSRVDVFRSLDLFQTLRMFW